MTTYYWIGGTGDSLDPTHWSLSSGGVSANTVPTWADDVIFNSASSSGSYTATIDNLYAYNWTISGPASGTLTLNNSYRYAYVLQSLTVAATGVTSNMNYGWSISSTYKIGVSGAVATAPTVIITTNNNSGFSNTSFYLDVGNSNYIATVLGSDFTAGTLRLVSGGFRTYNFNITVANFNCDSNFYYNSQAGLDFGRTTLSVSNTCNFQNMLQGTYPTLSLALVDSDADYFSTSAPWSNATLSQGMGGGGPPTYSLILTTTSATQYNSFMTSVTSLGQTPGDTFNINVVKATNTLTPTTRTLTAYGGDWNWINWNGNQLYGFNASGIGWAQALKAGDRFYINGNSGTQYTVTSNQTDSGMGGYIRLNVVAGGVESTINTITTITGDYGAFVNIDTGGMPHSVGSINGLGQDIYMRYNVQITLNMATLTAWTTGAANVNYSGGGCFNVVMTSSNSTFWNDYTMYGGPKMYVPKLTFQSTAANSDPHMLNGTSVSDYKQMHFAWVGKLVIEGPSTDGYTSVLCPNSLTVRKGIVSNITANQFRRVFFRGITSQNLEPEISANYTSYCSFVFEDGFTPVLQVYDTDFSNCKFSGSNVIQSGSRIGDAGGNSFPGSNFAFTPARTLYWGGLATGGNIGGNYSNWSLTNGGSATDGILPLPQDTIKFTNTGLNSGAIMAIGITTMMLPSIDCSQRTLPMTLAFAAVNSFHYGDLILSSAVTMTALYSNSTWAWFCKTGTIRSNGCTITKNIGVYTSGVVTVADNTTVNAPTGSSTTNAINLVKGKFDISGITLTATSFSAGVYPTTLSPSSGLSTDAILKNDSSSRINLPGSLGLMTWNVQGSNWNVDGPTPQVYGTTANAGNVYHFYQSGNDLWNSGYFKPIDFYLTGNASSNQICGYFGNLELVGGANITYVSSPYNIWVSKSLKVLYNAQVAGNMYLMAPTGNTLTVYPNWVYGSGATASTGANISWTYVGWTNSSDYSGTVKINGPVTFGGRVELRSGTFDVSNTTGVSINGLAQATSYAKTWNFNGASVVFNGPTPIYYSGGSNTTCLYDLATSLVGLSATNTLYGDGVTVFPPISFSSSTAQVTVSSSTKLAGLTLNAGQKLTITAGQTPTANKLVLNGTTGNPIQIASGTTNSKATIAHNGAAVYAVGVNFTDIQTSGASEFLAYQSTGTRTTGWNIKSSKRPAVTGFLSFC